MSYFNGDKPYLASGADLGKIKIWDYQTKQCIKTLDGHKGNVSSVLFHIDLPILLSTSEDGQTLIWHTNTYKLEQSLKYSKNILSFIVSRPLYLRHGSWVVNCPIRRWKHHSNRIWWWNSSPENREWWAASKHEKWENNLGQEHGHLVDKFKIPES